MTDAIDIGEFSEALNDKMDRDGRNTDTVSGADVIVERQEPTSSNNYTWYRLYKSGWVEQGGILNGANTSITYPIEFADTNYDFNSFATIADGAGNTHHSMGINKTTTGISIYVGQYGTGASAIGTYTHNWEAKGMSA